jgi:hypothetical protein
MLLPRNGSTERIERIDERAVQAGKVDLPGNSQALGLEKGTVYLQRPIPAVAPPVRGPAHAA